MLGGLLFICFAIGIPLEAAGAEDVSQWVPYRLAGSLLLVGFIAGLFLVQSVGLAATGAALGGVIGAVVALFNGAPLAAFGYVLVGVAGFAVSQIQAARADGAGIAR